VSVTIWKLSCRFLPCIGRSPPTNPNQDATFVIQEIAERLKVTASRHPAAQKIPDLKAEVGGTTRRLGTAGMCGWGAVQSKKLEAK
jgi:hypothetical protein